MATDAATTFASILEVFRDWISTSPVDVTVLLSTNALVLESIRLREIAPAPLTLTPNVFPKAAAKDAATAVVVMDPSEISHSLVFE